MAEQRVALSLFAGDTDAERGIGEALLHNADEFDYVLGHRKRGGVKGRGILRMERRSYKAEGSRKPEGRINCVAILLFYFEVY